MRVVLLCASLCPAYFNGVTLIEGRCCRYHRYLPVIGGEIVSVSSVLFYAVFMSVTFSSGLQRML